MRTFLILWIVATNFTFSQAKPRLELVAGGGTGGDRAMATDAALNGPFGVGFLRDSSMVIVEMPGNRIRRVGLDRRVETIGGTGEEGFSGDGGPASKARLRGPHHLLVTPDDRILVADTWNNRVRRIDPRTGIIETIAGTGRKGFSGDGGPAIEAEFGAIYCLALDESRQILYLADLDNRRIRAIDMKTGLVSTAAGNGEKGVPRDGGEARSEPLVDPRAVAVDRKGNLYILERSGNALRAVDRDGMIRTVVGTGKAGSSGDGGDGRKATLNGPKHLSVDAAGNVLIADTENHRVRVYHPSDGTIENLAGTGTKGSAGLGGPPGSAELAQPHGVLQGPGGIIFISDSSNNRVVKITP